MTIDDPVTVSQDNAGGNGPYHTFHDAENRLTRIEQDNSTLVASYKHDALGRRIERIDSVADPDVTTRCYYDGDQVIEDTDASANVQRYYLWGNYIDELLMMWREEGQTDADYFVARNHLFSPVALVKKSDASITERYEYDAYGKVTFMASDYSALNPQNSSVDNRYLFTGRELDNLDAGALKLYYYYRARYYDPFFGRFLQRDPIGYKDGMNLYEYVASRPGRYTDPFGGQLFTPPIDFPPRYPSPIFTPPMYLEPPNSERASCATMLLDIGIVYIKNVIGMVGGVTNDKFAHCYFSCRLTQTCGNGIAEALGILKEMRDAIVESWDPEDIAANDTGRSYGKVPPGTCPPEDNDKDLKKRCEDGCKATYGDPGAQDMP